MEVRERIIVALDVESLGERAMRDDVESLVKNLAPYVGCFKPGLELITAVGGPQIIELIHSHGGQVFYEGDFNNTPSKVGYAVKVVARMKVKMFSVHASAGIEAMKAAVVDRGMSLVLAVTVPTSLDENSSDLIFGRTREETVLRLANHAAIAGCDGIICSPQELEFLGKQRELDKLLIVTPGVRPEWAAVGDQKRVMTPVEAIKAGATALVIGRPITKPPEEIMAIGGSIKAAQLIAEEISLALKEMKQ